MDQSIASHLVFALLVLVNIALWVLPWLRVLYLQAIQKRRPGSFLFFWSVLGLWVTGILLSYFLQPTLYLTDAAEVLSSPYSILPFLVVAFYVWLLKKGPLSFKH